MPVLGRFDTPPKMTGSQEKKKGKLFMSTSTVRARINNGIWREDKEESKS